MSTEANKRVLVELFGDGEVVLSAEDEYNLRTDDYVMEMPQSGERIVGRDKMRALQEAYPNPPKIQIKRIIGEGDLFVMEAKSDYGNEVSFVANIVEFSKGKISKETRYYASPFEPPEWRSKWVEIIS
jgi:hypothetical protein